MSSIVDYEDSELDDTFYTAVTHIDSSSTTRVTLLSSPQKNKSLWIGRRELLEVIKERIGFRVRGCSRDCPSKPTLIFLPESGASVGGIRKKEAAAIAYRGRSSSDRNNKYKNNTGVRVDDLVLIPKTDAVSFKITSEGVLFTGLKMALIRSGDRWHDVTTDGKLTKEFGRKEQTESSR